MANNNGSGTVSATLLAVEAEDKKNSTDVTKWLQANEADAFIDEFFKQGYYKVANVDVKAIDSIVKPKQPGIANALKNLLAEQNKRAELSAMAPPKLPPDTVLDLSAPKLESPDGIAFSVPKSLSVESTNAAIVSPNNIKPEEWIVIARIANLLYAYDIGGAEPKWAKTPILDWKVPIRDDFARSEILNGKVTSRLTYSEETANYVASGFDTETASLGVPFCAASFERNHKEKSARSAATKTMIQIGMWKYPRAKLYLDKCTTTSERFTAAIRAALAGKDRNAELNKVFEEFGHVIPSAVLLGGQLSYKQKRENVASGQEQAAETSMKVGVEVAVSMVSVSAGVGFGSASETKAGNASLDEVTSFSNLGGDSILCTNPPQWASTVKDPNNWAVIEMEDMRSTIDLLEPELKKKVLQVWNTSQAILPPKELDWKDGMGVLYPDSIKITPEMISENGGFAVAMRNCGDGSLGSVQIISSDSAGDPKEGDYGTAAGAAYAHRGIASDTWYECSSICLPVPQGGSFRTSFVAELGKPDARLMFVPSNIQFGQWQCLSDANSIMNQTNPEYFDIYKEQDGFLFGTIRAMPDQVGTWGGIKVLLGGNGSKIAESYVSLDNSPSEHIREQCFCVPVPANTGIFIDNMDCRVGDEYHGTRGSPLRFTYFIPIVDERWKMLNAIPISTNTQKRAETDGILHGWIQQTLDGDRGTLKIYTGSDAENGNPTQLPCAAASIHHYEQKKRRVQYNSVMLPIAKGTSYKAVHTATNGNPVSQVYWTAIVPR